MPCTTLWSRPLPRVAINRALQNQSRLRDPSCAAGSPEPVRASIAPRGVRRPQATSRSAAAPTAAVLNLSKKKGPPLLMGPPPHAPCTRVRPHHASHTRERAALTRRPSPLGHPRAVPRTPMHHRTHALRPRAGLPHWPSSSTGHPSCAVHTRSLTREPSQRTCAEKSWPLRCNQARGSPPRTRANAPRSRSGHPHRAIPEPGTPQTHVPPELMHCARALAIPPSAILEHGDTCWLTRRALLEHLR